jgi:hypothetical protein
MASNSGTGPFVSPSQSSNMAVASEPLFSPIAPLSNYLLRMGNNNEAVRDARQLERVIQHASMMTPDNYTRTSGLERRNRDYILQLTLSSRPNPVLANEHQHALFYPNSLALNIRNPTCLSTSKLHLSPGPTPSHTDTGFLCTSTDFADTVSRQLLCFAIHFASSEPNWRSNGGKNNPAFSCYPLPRRLHVFQRYGKDTAAPLGCLG